MTNGRRSFSKITEEWDLELPNLLAVNFLLHQSLGEIAISVL